VKGLQTKDLRGNDEAELLKTADELRNTLFQNTLKRNTNQLENTAVIRKTRRDLARVLTILNEKQRSPEAATSAARAEAARAAAEE
jgi:large subunit ribosomal protein L29